MKATNPEKKYKVIVIDEDKKRTINFWQAGVSDYIINKDSKCKENYIARIEEKRLKHYVII
jgi:hypothetical protein